MYIQVRRYVQFNYFSQNSHWNLTLFNQLAQVQLTASQLTSLPPSFLSIIIDNVTSFPIYKSHQMVWLSEIEVGVTIQNREFFKILDKENSLCADQPEFWRQHRANYLFFSLFPFHINHYNFSDNVTSLLLFLIWYTICELCTISFSDKSFQCLFFLNIWIR